MKNNIELYNYINEVRSKEFDWNEHNCGIFVADGVFRMTGIDYFKSFRNLKTFASINKKLKALGYNNHIEFVNSLFDKIEPSKATTGDIAVLEKNALGFFVKDRIFCLMLKNIGTIERIEALKAFKVC